MSIKKYVYIAKWTNEVEKYVKYDTKKDDYLKVIVANAEIFETIAEAEKFVKEVEEFGYDRPEIIKVNDYSRM